MRRFLPVLLALAAAVPAAAGPMRDGERQRLLAHLDMTERWLVSELDGLSPEQFQFRMAPDSWTILDVVEHLAVAEPQYWTQLQESLEAPLRTEEPEATDAAILWYGIDRTHRARTGEARTPQGRYREPRAPLEEFRALRRRMREYAETTDDDLRGRLLKGGNMDVYQWFVMISAHAQRHVLQIREIKAHASYPRAPGMAGAPPEEGKAR